MKLRTERQQVLENSERRQVVPFWCYECGQVRWDIVELGKDENDRTEAYICGDCLRAAIKLLDSDGMTR